MKLRLPMFASFLALAASGCVHHVYSPPTRALPLDSAHQVGAGRTAIGIEGGIDGAAFTGPYSHGTARVRHGVTDAFEVALDGTVFELDGNEQTASDEIGAGRVGLKLGVATGEEEDPVRVAVRGSLGGGGGYAAGGGFVSPDLTVGLSVENPYVIPFVGGTAYISIPIDAVPVDVDRTDEVDLQTAAITYGFSGYLGVRIPLTSDPEPEVSGALMVAGSMSVMADGEEDLTFLGFSAGGEVEF